MRITPVPSILCGGSATSPNLPSTTSGLSNISRPTDPNPYGELLEAEGVYFVDLNRRILYWNHGATCLSGYKSEEVVNRRCQDDILCHIDAEGSRLCYGGCPLAATLVDGTPREADVTLRHKDGTRVPVQILVQAVRKYDGEIIGAIETFSDVNARGEHARVRLQEMKHLTFLDQLTQLPNRRRLEISLQIELNDYQLHKNEFGVVLFDIDPFPDSPDVPARIPREDTFHHVARMLARSLRPVDLIGRWAENQFLAVIKNIDGKNLDRLLARCVDLLSGTSSFAPDGSHPAISVSAGTAMVQSAVTAEELIQRAQDRIQQNRTARATALPS